MSEEMKEKTSNSYNIESKQNTTAQEETKLETFKSIPDENQIIEKEGDDKKPIITAMVRENGDSPHDEAAEKMLTTGDGDKEQLAVKSPEVKFIPGNGDAKIDIGKIEKKFTGMTKEELMKYVNDPFWIRLRWVLFIFFWAAWVAMLVGAILIIVYAPKCAKPTPLKWFEKGPLVKVESETSARTFKDFGTTGVIYELDSDKTYSIGEDVEKEIKDIVEKFKNEEIHVIVDLTPNYVTEKDELFKKSFNDESIRSAFIWIDDEKKTPNWRSMKNEEAFKAVVDNGTKVKGKYLSQFGNNRYDLQLSNEIAQNKLKDVLQHLIDLGVKGFRLANAKHFVVNTTHMHDEGIGGKHVSDFNEYNYWTHAQSTYLEEVGNVLRDLSKFVDNATSGEGFLSIKDDMTERPEAYYIKDTNSYGFKLPFFGDLQKILSHPQKLKEHFGTIFNDERKNIWPQWSYTKDSFATLNGSALNLFMMLLRGVPVVDLSVLNYGDTKTALYSKLIEARGSQVFMHGDLEFFTSVNNTAFGYTRTRSGNPGYFVACNPSNEDIVANFTSVKGVSKELSVNLLSDGYENDNTKKVDISKVKLLKNSAVWLTFVPDSAE